MKIVIAPDSFKNALRSVEVARALAEGWRSRRPDDEVLTIPLSDGGEGLTEAVVRATGGSFRSVAAHDPLMRPVTAQIGFTGGATRRAVMEMAAASGIELLKREERDPLRSTTFGAGELLRALLDEKPAEIIIGIGGSATVDGGAGLLQALGARFFDAAGNELPPGMGGGELKRAANADFSGLHPALRHTRIRVACDVTNPLLGQQGAAAVFGPQKGADPAAVAELESQLEHWQKLLLAALGDPELRPDAPGDGAAGGLGFALRTVARGVPESGAKLVMEIAGMREVLAGAALLVTGEGCSDAQTVCGKLPAVAAETARKAGVPTVLCSGALRGDTGALETVFAAVFSIAAGPGNLDDAIAATRENLRRCGANLAGLAQTFAKE